MARTTPYDCWVLFNSLKIHFKSKNGISNYFYGRFPQEKFESCPERFICKKLANEYIDFERLEIFLYSNFVFNPQMWFDKTETEKCKIRYQEARKIFDSPVYYLEKFLRENPFDGLLLEEGGFPRIFRLLLSKKVEPEIVCFLDCISPFLNSFAKSNNIVLANVVDRLVKYQKLCKTKTFEKTETLTKLIKGDKNG